MTQRATPEELRREVRILKESPNSEEVAVAAITVAGAEDAEALSALGELLSSDSGLARLDDLSDPSLDTQHLFDVFRALADRPTDAVGRLCEFLFGVTEFRALPERLNLLLATLSAVEPTTPGGADVFRASIKEGYAEVVGPLLLRNASQASLDVFEELIREDHVEVYVKVDILHRALLPMRYRLPVLVMCGRLLEAELPAECALHSLRRCSTTSRGVSSVPRYAPPTPLAWEFANTDALGLLVEWGGAWRPLDASYSWRFGQRWLSRSHFSTPA